MTGRPDVSVLLLARDETGDLEALLPTLSFVREVVLVWDPRGDRLTREAAERLGVRVHEREFDGFGPQRRHALAQCTGEWVLWIDADERLDGEAIAALAGALAQPGSANGFRLRRETGFLGRRIRYCGWQQERILRLFRREAWQFDEALVHERLHPVPGAVANVHDLEGTLQHESYATWEQCSTKLQRYAAANAEQAFRAGSRATVLDVAFRPALRFVRQYGLQLGFLDGAHGFVLCALAAAQVFLKYADLWARSRGAGAAR